MVMVGCKGGKSETSATSAIAEAALHFNLYFEALWKLRCGLKFLKFEALELHCLFKFFFFFFGFKRKSIH